MVYTTKWAVVLQDEDEFQTENVAVVLASTRSQGQRRYEWLVFLGPDDGMDTESDVDCRWIFTILKNEIRMGGQYMTALSEERMEEIAAAIVAGLCL